MELSKTEDGPSHNTISFDGGKIEVFVSNNNEGWDATVRVINPQTGKTVGTSRTYGRKRVIEVNAGNYEVEVQALALKGLSLKHRFENVVVEANETNALNYDYTSGELKIGVSTQSGELVDATVNVYQDERKKHVASGRTYTSDTSNPKKIIIQPGTYEIKIKPLGKHKGATKTEKITVSPGKTMTKIFKIE